jgi:hypothetical protein
MLTVVSVLVVIASIFVCADICNAQAVQRGLIGYWTFDEAHVDGETLKDVMGNYDGTIMGNPKLVEGKIHGAMEFNVEGAESDYIDLGHDISSKILKNFTVEGWFSFAELEPAGLHLLVCSRGPAGGTWNASKGLALYYCVNYETQGFYLRLALFYNGGPCSCDYRPFEPEIGEWYHFAITYDGSMMTFFANAENVGTTVCAKGMEESPTSLKIAHSDRWGKSRDFVGSVDEVRIYDRALSVDEVEQNFASEGEIAVRSPADKLVFTWGAIKASRQDLPMKHVSP